METGIIELLGNLSQRQNEVYNCTVVVEVRKSVDSEIYRIVFIDSGLVHLTLLDGQVSDACASNVASVTYRSLVNRRSLIAYIKFFQKCWKF